MAGKLIGKQRMFGRERKETKKRQGKGREECCGENEREGGEVDELETEGSEQRVGKYCKT